MATRKLDPPTTNIAEYSVSELSFALKRTVEDAYGLVRLRGEVSGYRGPHASGHCYFKLKDEKSAIEAVVWRGVFSRLRFKPEEGLEIVAKGKITTYPGRSTYQIVIDELEPAGAGALMALLEQRKKQLAAEGLFDEERKRALPFLPRVIGIVTSPTGAVIRDILHRLSDRFPSHVIVWPVRVQGETCASEVAAAIEGFNAEPIYGDQRRPDLIIVARGGGSLEDLWGFNEELVVRAAASSTVPLISAVGHETDWTLLDLVADYRAPTPTAAAERAVPVRLDLLSAVASYGARGSGTLRRALEHWRSRITASARGLPRREALLGLPRQRLDSASGRLLQALRTGPQKHRAAFARQSAALRPSLVVRRLENAAEAITRLDRDRARALSNYVDRARHRLDGTSGRLFQGLRVGTQRHRAALARRSAALRSSLVTASLTNANATLIRLDRDRARALSNFVERARQRLDGQKKLLSSLGYQNVLARGFALVRDRNGVMVRRGGGLEEHERIDIQFADGHVPATITGGAQEGTNPDAVAGKVTSNKPQSDKVRRPKGTSRPPDDSQGSLL